MFDAAITTAIADVGDSLLALVPAALGVGAGLLAARVGWKAIRSFIK